jgi:hypothetical protein
MAQGTSHSAEDLLATQQRRREVLQLKEAGATYEAIARTLLERHGTHALPAGYDRRYAYKDLHRELEKLQDENREAAESVRDVELRRLDRMLRGLWNKAVQGDPQAIDRVLKIMQRRAKMLGLDEPERFAQVVELVQSEEYRQARAAIMDALSEYPEARAAVANALDNMNSDEGA